MNGRRNHRRCNTYTKPKEPSSIPKDAFSFTRHIYEEQRQAFMNEQLSSKKLMQTKHSPAVSPEPPDKLHISPIFALKTTYRSYSNDNKGALVGVNHRRYRIQPQSYKKELDSLLESCRESQKLPSLNEKISRERRILNKFSRRMDWTLDLLVKNADLEYNILDPMFKYFTQGKLEDDQLVKNTARAIRLGEGLEIQPKLLPKRRQKNRSLLH